MDMIPTIISDNVKQNSKIYVAGHNGMVGSSVLRLLKLRVFNNLIFKSSNELDLRNQKHLSGTKGKSEFVINAAAKVGGFWQMIHIRTSF